MTWVYNTDYEGSPITITYKAKVDTPDKVTGTVDIQPRSLGRLHRDADEAGREVVRMARANGDAS